MGKKTREAEAAHRDKRAKLILDYQERMEVHARLTAKSMGLPPSLAIPALGVLCMMMAERNECVDEYEKAIAEFAIRAGIVSKEEYDSW